MQYDARQGSSSGDRTHSTRRFGVWPSWQAEERVPTPYRYRKAYFAAIGEPAQVLDFTVVDKGRESKWIDEAAFVGLQHFQAPSSKLQKFAASNAQYPAHW